MPAFWPFETLTEGAPDANTESLRASQSSSSLLTKSLRKRSIHVPKPGTTTGSFRRSQEPQVSRIDYVRVAIVRLAGSKPAAEA
jgi:hypothetical protein